MKSEIKIYDCAIIGGGAAGMMAAIQLKRAGRSVIIIEHTSKIGTKILQTGNGRCNFTNYIMNKDMYQNSDNELTMSVIDRFSNEDTIAFFESIGIYHRERNGYVYPHSDTAASLHSAMKLELEYLKVRVSVDFNTQTIKKKDNVFLIEGDNYIYYASTVILATGSKASPKSGSDGSGYELAKMLGHTIIKPLPALVQLVSDCKECRNMAGVRGQGKVSVYIEGQLAVTDTGELQYTDYGISGIAVFQVSRHAVKAVDEKKNVIVEINMIPDYTFDKIKGICVNGLKTAGYKTTEQFFEGIVNKKLALAACKEANVEPFKKASDNGIEQILKVVDTLMKFKFRLTGFKGFENAQICQGGVSLKDIDTNTMMSKIKPGLFFAGELVNVDGKCGGYNLQWAWSSASVAAEGVDTFLAPSC